MGEFLRLGDPEDPCSFHSQGLNSQTPPLGTITYVRSLRSLHKLSAH